MIEDMKHPAGVKLLLPVLLGLSALSIPSGTVLIASPGGEAIGAQAILPRLTQQVPFVVDFVPVGVFLLLAYGLLPILLSYGLWSRRRPAWYFTLALGATEVVWIGVEVALFYDLGFFFFYPIVAGMGLATLALCMLPSVRRFYFPLLSAPG